MPIAWRKHADGSLSGQVGKYVRLSVKKEKAPGDAARQVWAPVFHMALHPPPGQTFDTPQAAAEAIEAHVREALRETFRAAKDTWPRGGE